MKKMLPVLLVLVVAFSPELMSARAGPAQGSKVQSDLFQTSSHDPVGRASELFLSPESEKAPPARPEPGIFDPPTPAEPGGQEPPVDRGQAGPSVSGIHNLYPEDLNPPESCGVPLRSPFGKDVEIFLGPWGSENGGYRLDQHAAWYDLQVLSSVSPYANIAAVALSTERIAAVWKEGGVSGELYYSLWDSFADDVDASPGGWSTPTVLTDFGPDGDPALISLAGNEIEIYVRDGGKIKYGSDTVLGRTLDVTWHEIDGISTAASDPAVAVMDPYHKLVFYLDTEGVVWFTEWVGAWRPEPLPVFGMGEFAYLPIIAQQSPGQAGSARSYAAPGSIRQGLPPFTLASPLSALSRNENHAAVFGVDAAGQLWVNEWTQANASDWSDTQWVKLMEDVVVEKPAVATRHVNQMAVAVRSTSGEPYYIEWTATAGWKDPVALNNIFASPLALSATAIDSLAVYGVAQDGRVYEKTWDENMEWSAWTAVTGTGTATNQILAVPVRRMGDVMLLGKTSDGVGIYRHLTGQDRSLDETGIVPSGMKGYERGQALPWVDGKALWVTAHEDQAAAFWEVEAYDIDAPQTRAVTLYNHPYSAQDVLSVAQGDLELDGSEEVLLATHSPTSQWTEISVLNLTVTPTLGIAISDTVTISDTLADISVAVGDLDGDQIHNEVVLGAVRPDHIHLLVFEFVTETLALEQRFDLYVNYVDLGEHELEVTTGYLDSDICGDRQSLILHDTTKSYDGQYHVDGRIETYCLDPDTWNLELDQAYQLVRYTQPTEPAWGDYHSAVAAGDIDVDGYEEIIASFADKLVSIDPYVLTSTITLDGYWPDRSLAMGDIDRDGKAEVLLAEPRSGSTDVLLFETKPDGGLMKTGDTTLPGSGLGTVQVGDLDNDTFISELTGCASFHEPVVVAVVNGAPVWYENGVPLHVTRGSYSKTKGGGSGVENGTSYKLGGSITVGFSNDRRVPIEGTQLWEVRASTTIDFMHTQGSEDKTENITVYGTGYGFDDGLGIVVYYDTIYACFYYDLYHPDYPADKSRAMTCRPVAVDIQTKSSLEYWHSDTWKAQAGDSWVDVGHRAHYGQLTNDLGLPGNYPRQLPVDLYSVAYLWEGAPLIVGYDPNPDLYVEWWVEDTQMVSHMGYFEREGNVTVSAGFSVVGIGMDLASTAGLSSRHSNTTTWTDSLSFGGRVYDFGEARPCYGIIPYVYQATARTLAGTMYKYWAVDYYVPWQGACTLQPDLTFQMDNIPE